MNEAPRLRAGFVVASRRSRWIGIACLAVTAAGWGMNWPMLKLVLREWPPLFSRGLAGLTAALLLASVAHLRGEGLRIPRTAIVPLLIGAFTNVFAWMGFPSIAMQWLSVSEGALLCYTMPIWVTLLSWPMLGTRPTPRGISALALGVAGLVVLLGGDDLGADSAKLLGVVLALAAAVLFALGAVLNRKPPAIGPTALVAWQVGLGCLPMLIIGLVFEHARIGPMTTTGWLAQMYMTFVAMGVCYLAWFATLRHLPAATAAIGMLVVPLLGVLAAALVIGEPVGLRGAVALALTLSGVALALRS